LGRLYRIGERTFSYSPQFRQDLVWASFPRETFCSIYLKYPFNGPKRFLGMHHPILVLWCGAPTSRNSRLTVVPLCPACFVCSKDKFNTSRFMPTLGLCLIDMEFGTEFPLSCAACVHCLKESFNAADQWPRVEYSRNMMTLTIFLVPRLPFLCARRQQIPNHVLPVLLQAAHARA
jgi:hypothetical protein